MHATMARYGASTCNGNVVTIADILSSKASVDTAKRIGNVVAANPSSLPFVIGELLHKLFLSLHSVTKRLHCDTHCVK
jgi:hypothetical protein